jgi:hypothetical protein
MILDKNNLIPQLPSLAIQEISIFLLEEISKKDVKILKKITNIYWKYHFNISLNISQSVEYALQSSIVKVINNV